MIVSPADQAAIVGAILHAYPEKRRLIFVHIPKCAGTDMEANLGARYPSIHQTLSVPNWTPPERLQAVVDQIELRLRKAETIFVAGHHRLKWVLENGLYRPAVDRLFTIIREPKDILRSALNYTIGRLMADPEGSQPDTRGWLRGLGVSNVLGKPPSDLGLLALQSNAIPRNALCQSLGSGTAESALDMIRSSGIEITETARYSEWARRSWGLPFTTRHNASRNIIDLNTLPQDLLRSFCAEDLLLYPKIMSELGDRPSVTLYAKSAPSRAEVLCEMGGEPLAQDDIVPIEVVEEQASAESLGLTADLADALSRIGRLDHTKRIRAAKVCKVCDGPSPFFDVVDFLKCPRGYLFGPSGAMVGYYRCEACKFLFTPFFDTWTDVALQRFVYNQDYGTVIQEHDRVLTRILARRLREALGSARPGRPLIWGRGAGVVAAELISEGFPAEAHDPTAGRDAPAEKHNVIVNFDAVQRAPDPLAAFATMRESLTDNGVIVLGEPLCPDDIEVVRCNWEYIAPRVGRCSLFDRRTMAIIADRLGLVFRSRGPDGLHALHRQDPGEFASIVASFGPAIMFLRLGAPGVAGGSWHGVENLRGRPAFQWSASSDLTWDVIVPPGPRRQATIELPFVHIVPKFVEGCKLQVGSSLNQFNIEGDTIVGEPTEVETGPLRISLRTPSLVRADGTDKRMVGIALEVTGRGRAHLSMSAKILPSI